MCIRDRIEVAAIFGDYVNAIQQEITNLYGSNNIGVITPKAILAARQQFQSGSSSFTIDIAFIALLVGAIGIITTLYTSVNEKIKEIGTMKAIGAKNGFILSLFLSEALLIGLIGSTLVSVQAHQDEDHPEQRLRILPLTFFQMTFLMCGFFHYS